MKLQLLVLLYFCFVGINCDLISSELKRGISELSITYYNYYIDPLCFI